MVPDKTPPGNSRLHWETKRGTDHTQITHVLSHATQPASGASAAAASGPEATTALATAVWPEAPCITAALLEPSAAPGTQTAAAPGTETAEAEVAAKPQAGVPYAQPTNSHVSSTSA